MADAHLVWEAEDVPARSRSADWYWVLGIFAVAVAGAAILFGNLLFALVILTGAFALGMLSSRPPEVHRFIVDRSGIQIDAVRYPYENIISFCILEYIDPEMPPTLSLHTRSFFAPHIVISLEEVDPIEVYEVLSQYLEMEEHEETLLDRMVDFLRL